MQTSPPERASRPWLGWLIVLALGLGVGATFFLRSDEAAEEAPRKGGPKATPVAAAAVTRGVITERARYPGELDADAADIAAYFGGRVAAVKVRVGDRVEAGQALAELDVVDLEAQLAAAKAQVAAAGAEHQRATVELAVARKELTRMEPLLKGDLVSALDVELQRARVDALRAGIEAASARREQARAEVAQLEVRSAERVIKAPYAGRVAERYVDPGAYVGNGARLVRLVEEGSLRLRFEVPEHEVEGLDKGARLKVLAGARRAELTDAEGAPVATVTGVAAEVSRDRRVASVEASLEAPPPGWLPGMYAEALVDRRTVDPATIVPAVAVLSRLGEGGRLATGVFVEVEGAARWVPVRVLAREGERVAVAVDGELGLGVDARVLVAGHVDLADRSPVKVAEEPRAEAP